MKPADLLNELTRFWSRVDRSGDCWLWTGERGPLGYGYFAFWHDGKRSRLLAHRLALLITGTALGNDDVVLHACDVPACVNPEHLSVGTQRMNIQDAKAKGRMDTSGLFATTRRACKTCGEFFMGCARPDCEKDARQWGFCVNHSHLFRRNGVPYRQDEISEIKSSNKHATAMDKELEGNPPVIVWRLDPVRRVQVAVYVDDPHAEPSAKQREARSRSYADKAIRELSCDRGHDFDSWNTIVKPDGSYECRICTGNLDNGPLVTAARKGL